MTHQSTSRVAGSTRDEPAAPLQPTTRTLVVSAVVVLALIASLTAWHLVAEKLRSDVHASLSGPIRCAGTRVGYQPPGLPAGVGEPFITLTSTMHCSMTVRVINDGPISVRVESATLDLMGAHSTGMTMSGPGVRSVQDGSDSRTTINTVLGSHQGIDLSYQLTLSDQACYDPRTWGSTETQPALVVSALHLTGTQDGQVRLGWRGTAESRCGAGR